MTDFNFWLGGRVCGQGSIVVLKLVFYLDVLSKLGLWFYCYGLNRRNIRLRVLWEWKLSVGSSPILCKLQLWVVIISWHLMVSSIWGLGKRYNSRLVFLNLKNIELLSLVEKSSSDCVGWIIFALLLPKRINFFDESSWVVLRDNFLWGVMYHVLIAT